MILSRNTLKSNEYISNYNDNYGLCFSRFWWSKFNSDCIRIWIISSWKKEGILANITVNIMQANSVFVHTNVIWSTYVNGSQSPVIYSFLPDIAPDRKIIVQPPVPALTLSHFMFDKLDDRSK